MKETINFELTFEDYENLLSALSSEIGSLQAGIKSHLRYKDMLSKDSVEKIISYDERKIKEYSSLHNKLQKLYSDIYFL